MKTGICAYYWMREKGGRLIWPIEPNEKERKLVEDYVKGLTKSALIFWEDLPKE